MKKVILGTIAFALSCSSVFATTAVLCGKPEIVDNDNDKASVHLIFGNEDTESADDISVSFKGVDAKVSDVKNIGGKLHIDVTSPRRTLVIEKSAYEYSQCADGDIGSLFSIQVKSGSKVKTITDCHCFAD